MVHAQNHNAQLGFATALCVKMNALQMQQLQAVLSGSSEFLHFFCLDLIEVLHGHS